MEVYPYVYELPWCTPQFQSAVQDANKFAKITSNSKITHPITQYSKILFDFFTSDPFFSLALNSKPCS